MIINAPEAIANNRRIINDIYKIAEFIKTGKKSFEYLPLSVIIVQNKTISSPSCGWNKATTPVTIIRRKENRDVYKYIWDESIKYN